MPAKKSETKDHIEELRAENARLNARLDALEGSRPRNDAGELEAGRGSVLGREADALARRVPNRALDELDQLVRGLSYAAEEAALTVAESVRAGADRAFGPQRGRATRVSEANDRVYTENATNDVVAGLSTGILEAIEAQPRIVRRFYEAYSDGPAEEKTAPARNRPPRSSR